MPDSEDFASDALRVAPGPEPLSVLNAWHDEAVRRTEEAFGVEVPIVRATKETLVENLRPLVE